MKIPAGRKGLEGIIQGHSHVHSNCGFIWKHYLCEQFQPQCVSRKTVTVLNISLPPSRERKCHANAWFLMNNPTEMLPCKSLNAAGKWAFLPRLTAPQRWSRRLSLCNSTSCSVPALKHFRHDLGLKKKKKTSPLPLSFLPICGEIIFSFRNPWEWETERQQEGGREMLLTMPVDYWQLAKSHQKGWGRSRSLRVTWKNKSCSTLYSRGPAVSPSSPHFFSSLPPEHRATPGELTLQSLCWWGSLDLWHVWKHQ